jgi:hypothetical protein
MTQTLTALGSEFQVNINSGGNNGISGNQGAPDIGALTDGRFVVAYRSEYFGDSADLDPILALFNPDGTTSLAYLDAFNAGTKQSQPAV